MTVSWDNLNTTLEEPEQWWGLNVVENKIVTASIWGKVYNYLLSFLSSSLLENLQKVYSSSIEEIDISSELNESQKITVEKTSTLLQNNHCLFHSRGPLPDLERWRFLFLKGERTDLVQHHKEGGIYLNNPEDDYWGTFQTGVLTYVRRDFRAGYADGFEQSCCKRTTHCPK